MDSYVLFGKKCRECRRKKNRKKNKRIRRIFTRREFGRREEPCEEKYGVGLTCEANLGINPKFRSIKPSALLPVTRRISESLPLTLGLNTRKHSVDSLEIDWLHQISIKPRVNIFLHVSFDQGRRHSEYGHSAQRLCLAG